MSPRLNNSMIYKLNYLTTCDSRSSCDPFCMRRKQREMISIRSHLCTRVHKITSTFAAIHESRAPRNETYVRVWNLPWHVSAWLQLGIQIMTNTLDMQHSTFILASTASHLHYFNHFQSKLFAALAPQHHFAKLELMCLRSTIKC